MKKSELKSMVKHAYETKAKTHETEVVFQIYADGHYILDTEEDNVIDVTRTEEEAIEMCDAINDDYSEELGKKCGTYYKPILIDADSGERVTRANFQYYDLESEWVKNHISEMAKLDA